jgi:bis(5'-nucleosidyl)-tetraphosphatase
MVNVSRVTVFGIIPARKKNTSWQVFIIQHKAGHWGFPKGHSEVGEDPKQTAERELHEETGLSINAYYDTKPVSIEYIAMSHGKQVHKTAIYFIADVYGEVRLCPEEISNGLWLDINDVAKRITFDNAQPFLNEIQHRLSNLTS